MSVEIMLSFIVSFIVTFALVPMVMHVATKLDIVAAMNERTVHTKIVGRIGGLAIYFGFLVGTMIFLKTDDQINSILIAGFLIFTIGLYDDMNDLKAIYKMIGQFIASVIVIFYGGIELKGLPITIPYFSQILTLIWIVGITNAINLIDGLDGLSAGISIIVLVTISFTSLISGRTDIAALSLILAGSLTGFLYYNFYPAKIFMGDSGALFVGFMIAVISLLGFGYNVSTFFTLGAPIIVLLIPIMDTLFAILRRKLSGKKFSDADRKHLHHRLMYKFNLGHIKSVIVLYAITIMFSITSFIYLYDSLLGMILFVFIMIFIELFVELSNMITAKYKPLLTIINIFLQREDLPKLKVTDKYLNKEHKHTKWVALFTAFSLCVCGYFVYDYYTFDSPTGDQTVIQEVYKKSIHENELLEDIYSQLDYSYHKGQKEKEYQLLASYFLIDYLSIGLHDDEVGGINLVHPFLQDEFLDFALFTDYLDDENKNDLVIQEYKVISHAPSNVRFDDIDSSSYYNVLISYKYNNDIDDISTSANVVVVYENEKYYVVGVEYL